MRGRILAAGAVLLAAPAAQAGSLPTVRSGQPAGPPLLYAKAPHVPQLEVRAPFRARPLLVSGTDAYRGGEYLYQDYLFDDHGADTGANVSPPGTSGFSPASGDLLYPSAARYANNAADLVELRIKPTARAIVYRVTLGTVLADDATVVGIGIDTDRSGGAPGRLAGRRGRELARARSLHHGLGHRRQGHPAPREGSHDAARRRRDDQQAHQPDDDPRAALADGSGAGDLAVRGRDRCAVRHRLRGRRRRGAGRVQPRLPLRRGPAARRPAPGSRPIRRRRWAARPAAASTPT